MIPGGGPGGRSDEDRNRERRRPGRRRHAERFRTPGGPTGGPGDAQDPPRPPAPGRAGAPERGVRGLRLRRAPEERSGVRPHGVASPRRGGYPRGGGGVRPLPRAGRRRGGEEELLRVPQDGSRRRASAPRRAPAGTCRLRHQHLHPLHRRRRRHAGVRRDRGRAARGRALAGQPLLRPRPDGRRAGRPGAPAPAEGPKARSCPLPGEPPMNVIPTWEEIRRGDTTDIYFRRTMEVLRAAGKDRTRVVAEAIVKKFPGGYGYGILSGTDELLGLLSGLPVDVHAMEEGTLFHVMEPVFAVEGPYGAFCELETAMLGVVCQASGIATAASRVRWAAGGKSVLSFGARRMHPALSTLIDRNAFIGGADGVSAIRSAEYLGEVPQGTMPHALVLVFGDTVSAMRAFDATVDPAVPRVCLIDTLQDEKFEAVRVAEALRDKLSGVRLDTPGSRRGDFRRILQEVRWELDLRGFRHVRLIASGGLGEEEVRALRDVVDGFGVGTSLSNAPTIDYALDIVEVEGIPFAKRGKWSGRKQVLACDACARRAVLPAGEPAGPCSCGGAPEPMLVPAMRNGKALAASPPARAVRERVLRQLERFHTRGAGE